MLKIFSTILDWVATVFAILSPITIILWLAEITHVPGLGDFAKGFSGFFQPLNQGFEPLFRGLVEIINNLGIRSLLTTLGSLPLPFGIPNTMPHEILYDIPYQGVTSTITQGILGGVFTIIFLASSFGSQMLKTAQQKIDVTTEMLAQKQRLDKIKAADQKEKKAISTNRKVFTLITYDFTVCPPMTTHFETTYAKFTGKAVDITPDAMFLEFENIDGALRYAQEAAQQVRRYYATLRPMDAQPPFRIGIHAIEQLEFDHNLINLCHQLNSYAAENQVVLSHKTKELLDALNKASQYNIDPMGFYRFEGIGYMEVYRFNIR